MRKDKIPLSLPGEGTCVYFRTPHREARTPMVGALAAFGCLRFAPAVPLRSFAQSNQFPLASDACLRADVLYTRRTWYNTLKDDPKAYAIVGCAMRVHSILGYGFLESAYGHALEIEFKKAGIPYVREDNVRTRTPTAPL